MSEMLTDDRQAVGTISDAELLRVGMRGRPRKAMQSRRDAETRRRVLDAAQRLLERDDPVGIREIEAESGLARATIYRNFRSRDHILVELQLRWIELLEKTFVRSSYDSRDVLLGVIAATTESLHVDPHVAKAAIRARQSDGAGVLEACKELDARVAAFLSMALGRDSVEGRQCAVPFRLAWYGALTQWAQGLLTVEQLASELSNVARLMTAGARISQAEAPMPPAPPIPHICC